MLNLKINLFLIFGLLSLLYFYSSERDLLIYEEKQYLNNYVHSIGYADNEIKAHDLTKEYTYFVKNIFQKEVELHFLLDLARKLKNCKLFIYGGAVRDSLINNTIRDVDAKSNCPLHILIDYIPKDVNYSIVGDVIRINNPSIDISNLNSMLCNDFTINGFVYDFKNNILFNIYDSMIHLVNRTLFYGCNGYDPKYQLPFRFMKFKNRNYTYSHELEKEIYEKFRYVYKYDHNNYITKKNYYNNEWYTSEEDKKKFIDGLEYYEHLIDENFNF